MIEIPELLITRFAYRLLIEDFKHFMNFPEAGLRGALGYFWNAGGVRFDPLYETFFGLPGKTPPKAGMLLVTPCKNETDKVMLEVTFFGARENLVSDFSKSLLVLGKEGIGKRYNRFVVEGMTTPKTSSLKELIANKNGSDQSSPEFSLDKEWTLKLRTPLSLRDESGKILKTWDSSSFGRNLVHRIQGVTEAHGTPANIWDVPALIKKFSCIQSVADIQIEQQNRTSSRQQKNIDYSGIVGEIKLNAVPEEAVSLIRMGEQLAVGKNTVFGSGRIKLL